MLRRFHASDSQQFRNSKSNYRDERLTSGFAKLVDCAAVAAGLREKSDCLKVEWREPGGGTDCFEDLLIDRYITIVRGGEKWK